MMLCVEPLTHRFRGGHRWRYWRGQGAAGDIVRGAQGFVGDFRARVHVGQPANVWGSTLEGDLPPRVHFVDGAKRRQDALPVQLLELRLLLSWPRPHGCFLVSQEPSTADLLVSFAGQNGSWLLGLPCLKWQCSNFVPVILLMCFSVCRLRLYGQKGKCK